MTQSHQSTQQEVLVLHASDLHIGNHDWDKLLSFQGLCGRLSPDLIILSGDLTDGGRRNEYHALGVFLAGFTRPVFIVPGNHDSPVGNPFLRAFSPFSRFNRLPASIGVFQSDTVVVAELRTAAPIQTRLDWSKGVATPGRVTRALSAFGPKATEKVRPWRIVVSHHPLLDALGTRVPGEVVGGVDAVSQCVEAQVDLMLSGHTHQSWFGPLGTTPILMSTAPTLSSPRLRGEAQGFHAYRMGSDGIACEVWRWHDQAFHLDQVKR